MSSPAASTFLLRWKGAESGPFSIEEIRELLAAGEISRMHQVQVNGRWKLLDDFAELNAEARTEPERVMESRENVVADSTIADEDSPIFELSTHRRMSGLAIAALILGTCGFIPYVNLLSWIFALACGHLALMQIERNPLLDGRWVAITGLVMTYFLMLLGLTYGALMIYHGRGLF